MINYNGTLQEFFLADLSTNRGILFGDSVFETIRANHSKIYFSEEHYLRLMATMRICRMEIPMNFTFEFFEEEIFNLIKTSSYPLDKRVRFTVFRDSEGIYTPNSNDINYFITFSELHQDTYQFDHSKNELDIFRDYKVTSHLLSTIKTNNKMVNILAGVYAKEFGYDNCFLINEEKNIVEVINGNIFLKFGDLIITPPLSDGCLNGIMRNQIIKILKKENIIVEEKSVSPFDLQKADEIFMTNVIFGIKPVTHYKKKIYEKEFSEQLLNKIKNL